MTDVVLDLQLASKEPNIPSEEQLSLWASRAIQNDRDELEVTVRIVDEQESNELNLEYRGKDKPTNVLSFPFEAPEHVELNLLGDLVVCAPVVKQEAKEQQKTEESHWAHMIVHGVLHLQGFDHITDDEAEVMEGLEIKILNDLGYSNPYVEKVD